MLPPDVRSAIASRGPFPPDSDELARGRKWYEERGPGIGDWRKVMDAYHGTRKALSEAGADHRSLHAHWRGRTDAALSAAPGSAAEDSAAAEALLAYREQVTGAAAVERRRLEFAAADAKYRELGSETEAYAIQAAAEEAAYAQWRAEAKAELDREMQILVAKRLLIVAGGATVVAGASYAGYELAHVR